MSLLIMPRAGSLLLLLLFLSACATSPEKIEPLPESTGIIIEGIRIRNELTYGVTDVLLEVPATGAFAGCGNIMARTSCSNSFQEADYRANAILIRWKEHGQPHQTSEFVAKVPANIVAGQHAWVEVIIFAPGQAGAKLVGADDQNRPRN